MSNEKLEQFLNQKQEAFHNKLFDKFLNKIKEKQFSYSKKMEQVTELILSNQYDHQDTANAIRQELGIHDVGYQDSDIQEDEKEVATQQLNANNAITQKIKKKYYFEGGRLNNVLQGLKEVSNYIQNITGIQANVNNIIISQNDNKQRQFIAGDLQKCVTEIDELKFDKNQYGFYDFDMKHCYGVIELNGKHYDININKMQIY